MKGKTTIELTNINSGETKIYHDNNLVTNAINEIIANMQSLSPLVIDPIGTLGPLYPKLFGGVVLFDGAVNEDETTLPAYVNPVGYGAVDYIDTQNIWTHGDFVSGESYVNQKEVHMVWEFNTTKGNGDIASVCILPQLSAKIGLAGVSNTNLSRIGSSIPTKENIVTLFNASNRLPSDYGDGIVYAYPDKRTFIYGTRVQVDSQWYVQLEKRKYLIDEVSLFSRDYDVLSTVDIPCTRNDPYSGYILGIDPVTDILYLLDGNPTIAVGGTLYAMKVEFTDITDITDYTVTNLTFVNDTAVTVSGLNTMKVIDGILYKFDSNAILINLNDGEADWEIYSSATDCGYSTNPYHVVYDNGIFYFPDEVAIFNSITKKWKRIAASICKSEYNVLYAVPRFTLPEFMMFYEYSKYGATKYNPGVSMLMNQLMTINNLETPIVKTDQDVMKIKYTLELDINYKNYQQLLLHFDNSPIENSSNYKQSITPYGGVAILTDKKVFGAASCQFVAASSQYLMVDKTDNFNLGKLDFSFVVNLNPTDISGLQGILSNRYSPTAEYAYSISLSSGKVVFEYSTDGTVNTRTTVTSNATLEVGVFTEVAIIRAGTKLLIFIGGVLDTIHVIGAKVIYSSSRPIYIGSILTSGAVGEYYNGYMDELCFIVGAPLYIRDYTPPLIAFE